MDSPLKCPNCEQDMDVGHVLVDRFRDGICWRGAENEAVVEPIITLCDHMKSSRACRCGVCQILTFSPAWSLKDDGASPTICCPECGIEMEKGHIYPFIEGRHSPITVWWKSKEDNKEEQITFTDSVQTKHKDPEGKVGELFGQDFAPAVDGFRCRPCDIITFKVTEKK